MTKHIKTDNFKIHLKHWHFNKSEQKPAILLLHEGLGCSSMWKKFPEHLGFKLQMNVYAYDRLGYGLSDASKGSRQSDYMHIEAHIFLPDVLDAIHEKEVILLGHSDGGTIALLSRHKKVKAVVTMAAHVFVEDITIAGIKNAAQVDICDKIVSKLKKYHGSKAQEVFNRWVNIWLSPEFRHWDIRPELRSLNCPILAMQGSQDEYGTIQQLSDIKHFTSAPCRLIVFPNAGHSLHRDAEDSVIFEIEAFSRDMLLAS